MKNTVYIFAALLFLTITGCKSTEIFTTGDLSDAPPFTIEEAWYDETGTDAYEISIVVGNSDTMLDAVYFRGLQGKLVESSKNEIRTVFVADLKQKAIPNDLVLHADPEKEFGNKLPSGTTDKHAVKLRKNSAVISYFEDGKKKFYKIRRLQQR